MRTEKLLAIFLGISLFAASSGFTSAYIHAFPDALNNVISVGTVGVKLTEPNWDPQGAADLLPGSAVPKNPVLKNTGSHNAWLFLRLSVPVRHIALVNGENRRKTGAQDVPLFSFAAADSWELIEQTNGADAVNYVYGYKTLTKPGENTTALFEEVRLVNYLEGELSAQESFQIPVQAAAIQDKTCSPGASLKEIYQTYLSQER